MMALDDQPGVLHGHNHFTAQILVMVRRWNREISFLVSRPVSEIVLLPPRIPPPFFRIDEVKPVLLALIKSNAVEDEELRLSAEICCVRNAGRIQIQFRLARNVSRIPVVSLL